MKSHVEVQGQRVDMKGWGMEMRDGKDTKDKSKGS